VAAKIVAARFDEDDIEAREAAASVLERGKVDRGILTDGGMRATPGLDADDPVRRQRSRAGEELGILLV